MGDPNVVKAGWLFRQSTVLKRWRHNWFVLYQDGTLKYFTSPNSPVVEDVILIKFAEMRAGSDVAYVCPPKGCRSDSLLSIKIDYDVTWVLCAENADDMRAWHMSMEQLRVTQLPPQVVTNMVAPVVAPHVFSPVVTPMVSPGMTVIAPPGQIVHGAQPAVYTVQDRNGHQTIVYQQGLAPYYQQRAHGRRYHHGRGTWQMF